MPVWTCTDHESHYVGGASVVVASNEAEARQMLTDELKKHGLSGGKPFTLREINTSQPQAFVLHNGDY